jgi:hypothetical protein
MSEWTPRDRDVASRRIERITAGAAVTGLLASAAIGYTLAQAATAAPAEAATTASTASTAVPVRKHKPRRPRPATGGGSVSTGGS